MISYQVRVVSNAQGWKHFLELPFRIYKFDPHWVAPLKSEVYKTLDADHNPYFRNVSLRLFVCYRNNSPVARAIVVINRKHWAKFKKRTAFFGFFESIQDEDATGRLFETVERYGKSAGADFMEGPFNPNHYSELGMQLDNFDTPPVFFETYNHAYYPRLLESVGFEIRRLLHTRINAACTKYVLQRYGAILPTKSSGGFTVRNFNLFNMRAELERIREIYNDAFSENWHFLPLTREEYLFSAKFLFFVTYPKLIIIVNRGREPVGVLQCVLDINPILRPLKGEVTASSYPKLLKGRRRIRDIVIYAVGIKKAYQRTRVYKLLLDSMCHIALRYGVVSTTWMSEDNIAVVRASEHLGLKPYKHFAIFAKSL